MKTTLLKVTSILMIIFSAIAVVIAILGVVSLGLLTIISAGLLSFATLVAAIALLIATGGAIVEFIAGLTGLKACKNPSLTDKCEKLGIALLVIDGISIILTFVSGGSTSLLAIAFDIALPVLYIVGAKQLKESAPKAEATEE